MRDVGERAAMDKGGVVFKRLHEVWLHRVFQQNRHRAVGFDVAAKTGCGHGGKPRSCRPDVLQVLQVSWRGTGSP